MGPAPFIVVLDANVLYPFTLRDTLLRAAAAGFYQARWSSQILEETTRNVVRNTGMTAEGANRLVATMNRVFPEASVTGHELLIGAMPNEDKDRHVAAAAVAAGAQVIVTANLRDFQVLPGAIEAQSPDEFLGNLFDLDPDGFVGLLRDQASDLKKPPLSFDELLERLERMVPTLVAAVRAHVAPAG